MDVRSLLSACVFGFVAFLPLVAAAGDMDVQNFTPALGPNSIFSLEYGRTIGHLEPTGGVFLNYSSRALVEPGVLGDIPIADQQLESYVAAGLGVTEWLQFDLGLPVYLVNDVSWDETDSSGMALGDMLVRTKASFVHGDRVPFAFGALLDVTLPTGKGTALVGAGGLTVTPKLLADMIFGPVQVGANLGVSLRETQAFRDFERSNALEWSVGGELSVLQGLVLFSTEVYGSNTLSDFSGNAPIELLVGGKFLTDSGVGVSIAAGGGLTTGVGSPAFRTILGLTWAPRSLDYDGDGITDSADLCPQEAEDRDGFQDSDGCLEDDNDEDGIKDFEDACPNAPEDEDGFQDEDGCPDLDNDDDKVLDEVDQCPEEPEDIDGFEDADGCPDPDNDGDGIDDNVDACRDEAEDFDEFNDSDGCPENDNDADGVLDDDDACPNQPGLAADEGCPEVVDPDSTDVPATKPK